MYKKKIALLASLVLLASCGNSDNISNNGPEAEEQSDASTQEESEQSEAELNSISALYGNWTSGCNENDDMFSIFDWSFSSDQVVIVNYLYENTDASCSEPVQLFTFTYSASYLSEAASTMFGDAIKYDITPIAYTDYTGYDSSVDGLPLDIVNEYRIASVQNGKLYGGDLSTGDGLSSENRPTQIDTDFFLVRKP